MPCYHLTGDWNGDAYEVWIGQADHLLRKIRAKYKDHELEEIHREIVLNQPVDRAVFRFAPEEEAVPPEAAAVKATPSPKK